MVEVPRPVSLDLPVSASEFEKNAVLGFCPVHRHPVFVSFIDALQGLLGRVYEKLLGEMDIEAVQTMQRKARREERHLEYLEHGAPLPPIFWLFERQFIHRADLISTGWWSQQDQLDGCGDMFVNRTMRACKGTSLAPLLFEYKVTK